MPLVWNMVGELPVTIVGGSPSREVEDLAGSAGRRTGLGRRSHARCWSPRERWWCRSALEPGVKGKITQGMAAGLPVVTTPVGAEGLEGLDDENMLIGDATEALAERIVRVAEDDALWQALSRGGQRLVAANCSLEVLDERMRELLAAGPSDRMLAGREA